MQRLPFILGGRNPRPPRKHHHQSEILSGVMPRTPADVQGENPGKQRIPEMRNQSRQRQQQRNVYRENSVFRELVVRVIRAVNRGHEMRVIEQQRQKIKSKRPHRRFRPGNISGRQQQGSRPCTASHYTGPSMGHKSRLCPKPALLTGVLPASTISGVGTGIDITIQGSRGCARHSETGCTKMRNELRCG